MWFHEQPNLKPKVLFNLKPKVLFTSKLGTILFEYLWLNITVILEHEKYINLRHLPIIRSVVFHALLLLLLLIFHRCSSKQQYAFLSSLQ